MNERLENASLPLRGGSRKYEFAWPLLSRLSKMAKLSQASEDLLLRLAESDEHGAGQTIRKSSPSVRAVVVGSGWAARYRLLSDGRRQIVTLLLPGDIIQMDGEPSPVSALPVISLTKVRLLNAAPLRAAANNPSSDHAGLVRALTRAGIQSHVQLINQIVRLGRQSGMGRTAHLLVELHERLADAGLAEDYAFKMPLTHESLADTLGLSIVHVNRTLQQLRREKLLEFSHGVVRILKPSLMNSVADYDSHASHESALDRDPADLPTQRSFQTV